MTVGAMCGLYHIAHFSTGFIFVEFEHENTSANSGKFLSVPMTL